MGTITDIPDTEQWAIRRELDEHWRKQKAVLPIMDMDSSRSLPAMD